MGQITLYLDEKTAAKMKAAAEAEGLSQSKWVARLIQRKTASRWPYSVTCLAGAWSDLPDPESLRTHGDLQDMERETL